MISSVVRHSRPFSGFTDRDINLRVKSVEYAVRGPVEDHMNFINSQISKGVKYPFDKLIPCNIGNPYAVGKPIITFPREVIAVAEYPEIAKHAVFPDEVVERAMEFVNFSPATMGAYTHVQGILQVREDVAKFIEKRDGHSASPDHIYLSSGATSAIVEVLHTLINDSNDGVIIPIPQYPIYSALITLFGAKLVPYFLTEENGWSFDANSLKKSIERAHSKGLKLKCMVVINPGNPTGTILSLKEMQEIVSICEAERMMLIADEVYQENVYNSHKWYSFKKVAMDMNSQVQLLSLHSISKGFVGECGHRGGYVELHNIHNTVRTQLHKLFSLSICPNTAGQLFLDIAVRPPSGPVCGTQWNLEKSTELRSLEKRSETLYQSLSKLPGMKTQRATGAMYLFPKLEFTPKALKAASDYRFNGAPVEPDLFWALKLMDEEGIVVTPGSGFGQQKGTYHFRITFLPQEDNMREVIERISRFQNKFMQRYA